MSLKRERSPRLVEHLDVGIRNVRDEHVYTQTLNVSIDGFAIQCSMRERNKLTPQGDFVDDGGKPVEVDVNLQWQDLQGQKESVDARCRVVYSRRIAQDKCQIGMNFIELRGDGHSKLLMFIQNVLNV